VASIEIVLNDYPKARKLVKHIITCYWWSIFNNHLFHFTRRIHVLCNHFLNNYEPYLQLSNLCGNMCSCNLVILIINGLMKRMFNTMWACVQFYIHSS
jgi:hypothetical protein